MVNIFILSHEGFQRVANEAFGCRSARAAYEQKSVRMNEMIKTETQITHLCPMKASKRKKDDDTPDGTMHIDKEQTLPILDPNEFIQSRGAKGVLHRTHRANSSL